MEAKYYEAQKRVRDNDAVDPDRTAHVRTFESEDNVDSWRHRRMHEALAPLLRCQKDTSWLTVGDGRLASDARYLRPRVREVLATDISDSLLERARSLGYIEKWGVENAERLSFADDSFDYVLCKEAFHHFPRPMVALYEMLRVARRGVVLIEPHDTLLDRDATPLRALPGVLLKAVVRRMGLMGRFARHFPTQNRMFRSAGFEPSGNYIYGISREELSKVALGVGLAATAFLGINDVYEEGVESAPAREGEEVFERVKKRIAEMDRMGESMLLVGMLFKAPLERSVRQSLRDGGYDVHDVPLNHYLTGTSAPSAG